MIIDEPQLSIEDAYHYIDSTGQTAYVVSIGNAPLILMYKIALKEGYENFDRYCDIKINGFFTREYDEKVFCIFAGKLVELETLRLLEKHDCLITRGVRFFGAKPDDGIDLIAKGLSNLVCDKIQCKYWQKVHTIGNLSKFKKDYQNTRLVCGFSSSFDHDFRPPLKRSTNWRPASIRQASYGDWNMYELDVDAICQDEMTTLNIDGEHATDKTYPYVKWFEP